MDSNKNFEQDYKRKATDGVQTRFLPGTSVEIVHELARREHPPSHVLFDFDGTLSLVREGWQGVMVPMMVEILTATGTDESEIELTELVSNFVAELNGKQTIYQMIRLAEEIRQRGGNPEEPPVYKHRYHDLLMARIETKRHGLQSGKIPPDELLVPYSYDLLGALQKRGVQLYLASGTDENYVVEEAVLLGLDRYFGTHIYGAVDDIRAFSKKMVIERIFKENNVDGTRLLGFGDGYVEIDNLKSAGGIAVAVASDEQGRSGRPDEWKRDRLIGIGADIVIPDYRDYSILLDYIWNGK